MLRTLSGRAYLAVILLWIAVGAAVLDAYAHADRLRLVQEALDSRPGDSDIALPADTVDRADTLVTIALVGSTVVLVLVALAWLAWQYRLAVLLRAAGGRAPAPDATWRTEPRTGVLVWLVPVANLVAPLVVVDRLARVAGQRIAPLVAAWWVSWIASAVLTALGTGDPEALADQRLPDGLAVAGDVLTVVAAVLAIRIVSRLTDATLALAPPPAQAAEA